MINRVLIRVKVVQLLYSYLLVANPFNLESQPTAPTKEKRFAYALYLDTMLLMVRIAENITKRGGEKPLYDTRFISRVVGDDRMRTLRQQYLSKDFPLESLVPVLTEVVKESGIYKKYVKNGQDWNPEEDKVWKDIFDTLIINNPEYNAVCARRENYSLRGMERMRGMVDETFKKFFASADHLPDALKTLQVSLLKARELYIRLLQLPIELTELRARQIDDARHKYIKTQEDINPNMRFVDNEFVKALAADPELHTNLETFKFSWLNEEDQLMRSLLRNIMESEIYERYMNFPATDFNEDCEFWRQIYKNIILRNTDFLEFMEDKSVYWNDDLDIIGTFVLKTVRRFQEGATRPILPMYKDEEDAAFGKELFSYVITKKDIYRNMIRDAVSKVGSWETERLAFMDVVIVMTAMAEILNFPKIPLNVSCNEYVEIAKCYSTGKSGSFVNGVLSTIIGDLQQEGKLFK
ncbi:MAG: transcription antitermination protein NusB [Muribaculum sp.]|nr:transcription antitermination protein NusB [Muribaculum sp.]